MNFVFTILTQSPEYGRKAYIDTPQGVFGWAIWLILALLIGLLLYHWRSYNKSWGKTRRRAIVVFVILCILTPITSLLIGIEFDPRIGFPPPGAPLDPGRQIVMVFSAVPWILAGGFFGPLPAAVLGLLSGSLQAYWGTHSPFTPLEIMLLAVLFSSAVMQRYRTKIYQLIRQPAVAAIFLAVIYPFLYWITAPFTIADSLSLVSSTATRLDYAVFNLPSAWLSIGIPLAAAGALAQILVNIPVLSLPIDWGSKTPLRPSPAERSLQTRFLYILAPLGILLIITLMVGSWLLAGAVARDLLKSQMKTTAQTVANQVPYFLQSGQSLISQFAVDSQLNTSEPGQLYELLGRMTKSVAFYDQLVVLNEKGEVIDAYPDKQYTGKQIPIEEQVGIQLALNGLPFQTFTLSPKKDSPTAQISFVAAIPSSVTTGRNDETAPRVILGRADLATNPFTKPIISSLGGMSEFLAKGMLLDQNGRILAHPDPALVMTTYSGKTDNPEPFYNETAPDGTRNLVYYQPTIGSTWAAVITVPVQAIQQLSLRIALPLLGMILTLSIMTVVVLNLGLRVVTSSLESLAAEAEEISRGKLNQPLPVDGEDEVGHLRREFEKMRISLKARLDELNRLLIVSQGVSSSLEMEDAVKLVLESVLVTNASVARIVLSPSVMPELDGPSSAPICYCAGPAKNLYGDLDEQILGLVRQQDQLILSSLTRPRLLTLTSGLPYPTALIAFALNHENQYYGAMWAAYDQAHVFSEEEVRYLATLANQATTAASNARLFLNAETGRQRLAAILASSPDPVLVTDQHNRLILANPAAWQLFGIEIESETGQPIEKVISQKELINLFLTASPEITTPQPQRSAEVTIQPGLVYLAAVSSVVAEGRRVGQVCVLRNVTQFKELDALKTEFVSTVSHDLRTPLALMRGYATMLEMVGQLNEQQSNYVRKIVGGVESMSRLVNNLLDLGRIETGIGLQTELIFASDVVERVVSTLQLQATQKKIQIKTEFPSQETALMLEADPPLLQQALHNLLDNAIRYTRTEGKVTVRVLPQAERVIFEVCDTGIGISPMDQPHLFEKFYRGPQAGLQENQGSGLGLAIVRSIAEHHSGHVWVESQLGKGSTFYLAVPLRQPAGVVPKIR